MEVRGFEVPSEAFEVAVELLGQLTGIDKKTIVRATGNKAYKTVFVSKGFGKGQRRLDIPDSGLRFVQKRLLKSCLYHAGGCWSFEDWHALKGFKRGKSIVDNIEPHIVSRAFFQLDFADAFPSVTADMLRDTLEVLFEEATVRRMFRFRKVRWFREAFLQEKKFGQPSFSNIVTPLNVLWALREVIIMLATLEDKLPQGAPTSPHLFNMTVESQGVATLISSCLDKFRVSEPFVVTIYADNITISTVAESIVEEARIAVIDAINSETSFRIKPEKTRYWVLKNGSGKITGLSIGVSCDGGTFVTIPQSLQKRARGLIHGAIFDKELRGPALGMVAFLRDVYGDNLPGQIENPYSKLLAVIG